MKNSLILKLNAVVKDKNPISISTKTKYFNQQCNFSSQTVDICVTLVKI
jgi:hypothetical protein